MESNRADCIHSYDQLGFEGLLSYELQKKSPCTWYCVHFTKDM